MRLLQFSSKLGFNPNIGFIFERAVTVFTLSDITTPKVNSSFNFYRWNQFKVIPWPVYSVEETSANFLLHRTRVNSTADNANNSQSQAANDDRLLSRVTLAAFSAGSKQLAHR